MIIKIKEVTKTFDDYSPDGKKWTLYSKGCKVEIDGKDEYAKVKTFTPKLEVVTGAVFTQDENCGQISVEDKEFNGSTIKEVTIKSKPSDFKKGGFSGGQKFVKISMAQLLYAVGESENIAKGLSDVDELKQKYFASILDVMVRMTEIPTEEKKDVAKEVEKAFDGKEVFNDSDIPF